MLAPQTKAWLKKYEPYETPQLGKIVYKLTTANPAAPAKEMVVKVLNVQLNDHSLAAKNLDLIKNEYDQMEQLKSIPQVVSVFDKLEFEQEGSKWVLILMEYAGEPLSKFLHDPGKKLGFEEKIKIMFKLAQGLQALEEKKTAHFDIKPDNVTYKRSENGENVVKIIDFGTAIQSGGTTQFAKTGSTGTILGYTVDFAPPEVLSGGEIRRDRIDVYCFGKTCFQLFGEIQDSQLREFLPKYADLLSEKPLIYKPNDAKYAANFLSLLQNKTYPDDETQGVLSLRINKLLSRALEFKPDRRPPFSDILAALEHIHDNLDARPSCYVKCEECYTVHPQKGMLYSASSKLIEPNSNVKDCSRGWPIEALKGVTEFGSIFVPLPTLMVFVCGGKKGDTQDCLGTIFTIDVTSQRAVALPASLKVPRREPTLVTDGLSIFVLGGRGNGNVLLNSCEEFVIAKGTTEAIAPLNEEKARMAACMFNGLCIYVFGGEREYFPDEDCKSLIHNYSTRIEVLQLGDKSKWVFIDVADPAETQWNGCGLSGACQLEDRILICGGFILNKKNPTYSWNFDQIVFDPKTRKFSAIEEKHALIVEHFTNSVYCLKGNILLASTTFKCSDKEQSFYSSNDNAKTWSLHMLPEGQ